MSRTKAQRFADAGLLASATACFALGAFLPREGHPWLGLLAFCLGGLSGPAMGLAYITSSLWWPRKASDGKRG